MPIRQWWADELMTWTAKEHGGDRRLVWAPAGREDPLYGQGMSVAVLEALTLHGLLEEHGHTADLPRRAVRAFAGIIDTPWQIAVGADLAYPGTTGARTPLTRLTGAYGTRVLRATTVDPVVGEAMFQVQNLLAPASRLMRPDIVARTLRAQRTWRRDRRAQAAEEAPGPSHDLSGMPATAAEQVTNVG